MELVMLLGRPGSTGTGHAGIRCITGKTETGPNLSGHDQTYPNLEPGRAQPNLADYGNDRRNYVINSNETYMQIAKHNLYVSLRM